MPRHPIGPVAMAACNGGGVSSRAGRRRGEAGGRRRPALRRAQSASGGQELGRRTRGSPRRQRQLVVEHLRGAGDDHLRRVHDQAFEEDEALAQVVLRARAAEPAGARS